MSPTETSCVGSWAFSSRDDPTTLIVYHLDDDRGVREEHYHLSSATPDIPRITQVGSWRVESDGRLVIEPNSGLRYAFDSATGLLGEFFDDGRRGWARPANTRIYWIDAVTHQGLECRASYSSGPDQGQFTMHRFAGATAVYDARSRR